MGLEQCRDGKSVWMARLQSLKHNWLQLTSSVLLNEWVVSGAKRYTVVCEKNVSECNPPYLAFLRCSCHKCMIYLLLLASLILKVFFREVISTLPMCTSISMLCTYFKWLCILLDYLGSEVARFWKVIYGGRSSDKHCLAAKMKRQAVLHIPWHQLALFDPVSLPGNTRAWSSENLLFHTMCVFGQNIG